MSDVHDELRAVLNVVERAFARATNPAELAALTYDPDEVVIVGEGDASAMRGVRELLVKVESSLAAYGPRPRVKFSVAAPVLAADGIAVAMLDAECLPDQPGAEILHYRVLTGWRRGVRGWRIVMEMITLGRL